MRVPVADWRTTVKSLTRRDALATLLNFVWLVPLAVAGTQLLRYLRFEPPATGSTQFSLGKPAVLPKLPAYFENGQVWLMQDAQGYYAMDAVCTHLGCIVRMQPTGDEVRSPCHGSRFDLEGKVLQGPATRPLPFMRLYWSPDGNLTVDRSQQVNSSDRLPAKGS
jgi:Rieske Fe-S protein